jgi:hypothetical protein
MISFTQAEKILHDLMHIYFDTETEDYLMFGVLLCEWSDESTLRIINSGFPPALTHRWQ